MIQRRRSSITGFLSASLGVACLALVTLVTPAVAGASPDPTFSTIYPANPCTTDTVRVLVQGYLPTPCDSFVGAFKVNDRTIRRITRNNFMRQCFAAPFQFYSVPVVMGRFPAGPQEIQLEQWSIIHDESGAPVDTSVAIFTLTFQVSESCALPQVPAEKLPFVLSAVTRPNPPCPGQPTTIHLEGVFPDGCGSVVSVDPTNFSMVMAPYHPDLSLCTQGLKPWSADFPLGAMTAGHHRVLIRMTVLGSDGASPPIPTLTYDGLFAFDIPFDCHQVERLPYVSFIQIGPKQNSTGQVCENDSIQVTLGGTFPDPCFRVDSLVSEEAPYASPLPMPRIIRLVVSDQGCTRIACPAVLGPWTRSLTIPGLPRGSYTLHVEEARTVGCPPIHDLHAASEPFTVTPAESCGVANPHCLYPAWPSSVNDQCSAFISPGDTAGVVLGVVSPVALAGLEGTLHVSGEGARIVRLETVGSAVGMHLSWTPTADGVRFVMFALQGAPIPGVPPPAPAIVPVLLVRVALTPQSQASRIEVATGELLGSDAQGQGVPACLALPRILHLPPVAVICVTKGECDYNADGLLDVRDLVLMARCVVLEEGCPADVTRFDCDGDGALEVDDVLCCATELLRGPGCPNCPADTMRAAPEIAVRFGAVRSVEGGLEVPLLIDGTGSIGASRLRIRFPSDRFRVSGVVARGRWDWVELHRTDGNELSLGLLAALGAIPAIGYTGDPLEVTLRLEALAGMEPGGSLALLDGDFSGRDGVKLRVDLGGPTLALGEVGGVSLTNAHPNPFESSTRFSVQLDRPGLLDVGIYDLAGRRITTLFHGPAEAGSRPITWDGRGDDGRGIPGGIYFYRAVANGHSVTRRMVMLHGR